MLVCFDPIAGFVRARFTVRRVTVWRGVDRLRNDGEDKTILFLCHFSRARRSLRKRRKDSPVTKAIALSLGTGYGA